MRTRHTALAGAIAVTLGLAGAGFAQTASPGSSASNPDGTARPAAEAPARPGTQAVNPMTSGSRASEAPGMGSGAAQPADPGATRPGTTVQRPMPNGTAATAPRGDTATGSRTPASSAESGGAREGAPLAGANSFTEGQARSRISDAGFADVQDLRLDERGVWRGRGMRNGQQVGVALDYQGNVVGGQ